MWPYFPGVKATGDRKLACCISGFYYQNKENNPVILLGKEFPRVLFYSNLNPHCLWIMLMQNIFFK
jgi:hypothetical protein